ncbi:thioredoxin-dependent thiol peroxidase [Psychromarinibacter halotolerans]|uniref:thioredoxin-dependent peroxiredoxin n=1 Tax=Psychromarinibacter halotolerans TaxID=1775175 RepID=A0ABV7H098_9RHOB|nr:thioredoxin-dependent thiol peroxidase [Psychromarinibacter halotolerans]MDF0598162.1 thioredoxin-dependent thiol peroxidase [Psychromarinibacter halotolerans]
MIEKGQTAPDFTLPRDGGGTVTLSELQGAPIVLYFYPKDDTSGCTREAQDFTEAANAFKAAGCTVLGVSKDTVAKHDKFREKHDLGITLLSDAEGNVCETYGTWVEKSMYGRKFMGIERTTFLIDAKGTVQHVWNKVKVAGHVSEVLAAAKAI